MKADDNGNKRGLPDTIYKSVKGAGDCCPSGNSCCYPAREAESEGKKKKASIDAITSSKKLLDIEWKHFAVLPKCMKSVLRQRSKDKM
jgi:hypothetical protein